MRDGLNFSVPNLAIFMPALIWIALLFVDLKRARMLDIGFDKLALMLVASTVILGPGAAVLAGWIWREEVLATKRHWGAVVRN